MRSTLFLCFVLVSFIFTPSHAQQAKKTKPFRTWIKHSSGANAKKFHVPAYLVELKDSSIVLAYRVDPKANAFLRKKYKVSEISMMKFRKEKIIGRGILVSSLVGFTFGGILGGSQGGGDSYWNLHWFLNSKTANQAGLLYGSFFGIIAAAFMGPAFALKIKVAIKGDQAMYEEEKDALQKFLFDLEESSKP